MGHYQKLGHRRQAAGAGKASRCLTLVIRLLRFPTMRSLELKIPPPVVALLTAVLMWFSAQVVPSFAWSLSWRITSALLLAGIGGCFSIAGAVSFIRARTTFSPLKPAAATSLVTSGVFRFTRNPMYVGLAFVLLGWAAFLANGLAVLLVPCFVLYMNRFQIAPEEKVLSDMFGTEFANYQAKARRWL